MDQHNDNDLIQHLFDSFSTIFKTIYIFFWNITPHK